MSLPVTPQENNFTRAMIADVVARLSPFDFLEQQHIHETLLWIHSGVPLFRTQKPDIPPQHLVSYFIILDETARKILLCDHKKAQLWLPLGGHGEPNELPGDTVRRECQEELKSEAEFWQDDPFFLTSTVTVGLTPGHTDVSLWYILKGNQDAAYSFDVEEFTRLHWFGFDEIPYERSDPHMSRFMKKLEARL